MNYLEHEVFQCFEEISKIPRGSGNTAAISNFLFEFGNKLGFETKRDNAGNVVIFKPASEGMEERPCVMLQGHMDMVCEKTPGSEHDFTKDPIRFVVKDNFLYADKTTLGADDGIAVAYMMALLKDSDLKTPALECVFTVDEEIGLLGAQALEPYASKASYMLNLDSEDEGHFCVGCAGGRTVHVSCRTQSMPIRYLIDNKFDFDLSLLSLYTFSISGFMGGHSGTEINREGANANKVLARLLYRLFQEVLDEPENNLFALKSFRGGSKDNVIPSAAVAGVVMNAAGIEEKAEKIFLEIAHEYNDVENKLPEIHIEKTQICRWNGQEAKNFEFNEELVESSVCSLRDTVKILFFLNQVPNGVSRMEHAIPSQEGKLVRTSSNLAVVDYYSGAEEEDFKAVVSVRSSIGSEKDELCERITFLAEFESFDVTYEGDYPQWEFRADSIFREKMTQVYRECYGGAEPIYEAIHAGVECGLIAEKFPGLDIVSIGPDLIDIHTPEEHADMASVIRTYDFIKTLLEKI